LSSSAKTLAHCANGRLLANTNEGRSWRSSEAFAIRDFDREVLKWHAKYARQTGIYAPATFMIDGLVDPNLSSGDDVSATGLRARMSALCQVRALKNHR
jgi:hypothetical protein